MKKIITLFALAAAFTTLMVSCQQNFSAVEDIEASTLYEEKAAANILDASSGEGVLDVADLGIEVADLKAGIYTISFSGENEYAEIKLHSPWWGYQSSEDGKVSPMVVTIDDAAIKAIQGEGDGGLSIHSWSGQKISIDGIEYKPLPAPAK